MTVTSATAVDEPRTKDTTWRAFPGMARIVMPAWRDERTLRVSIVWLCRCTHPAGIHTGGADRSCSACQCSQLRVRQYQEAYGGLREIDEPEDVTLETMDAALINQMLGRLAITRMAQGGAPTEREYLTIAPVYADERLVALEATLHSELPDYDPQAAVVAVSGRASQVLDLAGHRGFELFGVDLDGRRYYLGQCHCCGNMEATADDKLSRGDTTDPAWTPGADRLAGFLASLFRDPGSPGGSAANQRTAA